MSRISPQQSLRPSILDSLIDPDSAGTAWRAGYGLQQILEVVRRDLEDLLNTRRTALGPPGLQKSIYAYGLPDLNTFEAVTPQQKEALGRALEQTIQTFEPRLSNIQATLTTLEGRDDRSLAFRVDAHMTAEPYDDVTFQTILELGTGHYSVQKT